MRDRNVTRRRLPLSAVIGVAVILGCSESRAIPDASVSLYEIVGEDICPVGQFISHGYPIGQIGESAFAFACGSSGSLVVLSEACERRVRHDRSHFRGVRLLSL